MKSKRQSMPENRSFGQYLIHSKCNNHYIGLTWRDGETLNGKEEEFFIYEEMG